MRGGDFSELNRVIYDPTTGQPFPGNVIPSDRDRPGRAQHPDAALSRAEHRRHASAPTARPINNYLINPIKERQDNQFDVKVDHNLLDRTTGSSRATATRRRTASSRRRCRTATPARPSAPATATSRRRAWRSTTRTPSRSNWLNEFRFGWSSIKFFDDADRLRHQPGARRWASRASTSTTATSAMTQLTFQNIRNLGANSNQPLITNQNDFQIFDNVTWIKGKHTLKAAAASPSARARSSTPTPSSAVFSFNNNMTSNCAGQPAGCTVNSAPASTWPASCSAYVNTEDPQPVRRRAPTPRSGRSTRSTCRTTSAPRSKLTLNLGLRWDVYPPWIEIDDRQSNFDETTGKFVVASDDAVIDGVEGRPLPADLLEGATSARASASPTTSPATARRSSAAASACSGTSRPAARRRRRRRTRRSCSRRRSTPTPTAYGSNLLLKDGLPPPPGVDPNRPAGGHHALDLRHQLPRRLRAAMERQRPARARHATTWSRSPTSARRAGRCCSRATPTRRRPSSA